MESIIIDFGYRKVKIHKREDGDFPALYLDEQGGEDLVSRLAIELDRVLVWPDADKEDAYEVYPLKETAYRVTEEEDMEHIFTASLTRDIGDGKQKEYGCYLSGSKLHILDETTKELITSMWWHDESATLVDKPHVKVIERN